MVTIPQTEKQRLLEIFLLFVRFGITAFGGPAAHIAMFHDEVVERRKWISHQQFLDLLGATNLIPGPNSTEMAIHLGYLRAGWKGLILAGTSFIFPAMLIVTFFAWLYTQYGNTPQAEWIFYGIQPVIIAIILSALIGLGRVAIKNFATIAAGTIALILYFLNINPVLALIAASLVVPLAQIPFRKKVLSGLIWFPILPSLGSLSSAPQPFDLGVLFFTFLKIGSVLYGSGYVLLAFLHGDFVDRLGWLTEQQLLDAVAYRPIYTWSGVHHSYIHRLYNRRHTRSIFSHPRDIPAVFRVCCHIQSTDPPLAEFAKHQPVPRWVKRRLPRIDAGSSAAAGSDSIFRPLISRYRYNFSSSSI